MSAGRRLASTAAGLRPRGLGVVSVVRLPAVVAAWQRLAVWDPVASEQAETGEDDDESEQQ